MLKLNKKRSIHFGSSVPSFCVPFPPFSELCFLLYSILLYIVLLLSYCYVATRSTSAITMSQAHTHHQHTLLRRSPVRSDWYGMVPNTRKKYLYSVRASFIACCQATKYWSTFRTAGWLQGSTVHSQTITALIKILTLEMCPTCLYTTISFLCNFFRTLRRNNSNLGGW